jgi:hypothetical protein
MQARASAATLGISMLINGFRNVRFSDLSWGFPRNKTLGLLEGILSEGAVNKAHAVRVKKSNYSLASVLLSETRH